MTTKKIDWEMIAYCGPFFLAAILAVLVFGFLFVDLYYHSAENARKEIERERRSMEKCGRPGTSSLFPDLRPCEGDE